MLIASAIAHRVPEAQRDWTIYLLWLLVGFAAVLGHMFSVFLKFSGGKGVATSAGVMLGLWPYFTLPGVIAIARVSRRVLPRGGTSASGRSSRRATVPVAYLLIGQCARVAGVRQPVAAADLRGRDGAADHLQAPHEHRPAACGDGEPDDVAHQLVVATKCAKVARRHEQSEASVLSCLRVNLSRLEEQQPHRVEHDDDRRALVEQHRDAEVGEAHRRQRREDARSRRGR